MLGIQNKIVKKATCSVIGPFLIESLGGGGIIIRWTKQMMRHHFDICIALRSKVSPLHQVSKHISYTPMAKITQGVNMARGQNV